MSALKDTIAQLREARESARSAFMAFTRKIFLVRAAQARLLKNPAHRVMHAMGAHHGLDPHWPRAPGAARRAKLRKISRASRRRNLRGRA